MKVSDGMPADGHTGKLGVYVFSPTESREDANRIAIRIESEVAVNIALLNKPETDALISAVTLRRSQLWGAE